MVTEQNTSGQYLPSEDRHLSPTGLFLKRLKEAFQQDERDENMTSDQIEQKTRDLIKQIVSDETATGKGANDIKRIASRLRDVSFHIDVAAQELERSTT